MTNGRLVTPNGIVEGAVKIVRGYLAAIWRRAPRGAQAISLRGAYLAPGFIDLHVWGDPPTLSRELVKHGTTAFLAALGPAPRAGLLAQLETIERSRDLDGARCLGAHLEGPFLSRERAGALPRRWMRAATRTELRALARAGHIRLMTMAPELRGTRELIRWCRRHRIIASLGHSAADAKVARRAVDAGATAVTHVFNGMRPLHHRHPSLVDVALTDPRLTTMVILDGIHVSLSAFRLLVRAKGPGRIALVTDSIQRQGWDVVKRRGAYYTRKGLLAGSALTMIQAVRNAMELGDVPLVEAVRMATETPARLLGDRSRGALEIGRRADLVVFDQRFRVKLTVVGGTIVYQSD